jgi:hypothetical protein
MTKAIPKDDTYYNFYGVILDASFPYKGPSKAICTLKVTDASTLNYNTSQLKP